MAEWRRLLDAAKQGRLADEIGKQLQASNPGLNLSTPGGRSMMKQGIASFEQHAKKLTNTVGKLQKPVDKVKNLARKGTK